MNSMGFCRWLDSQMANKRTYWRLETSRGPALRHSERRVRLEVLSDAAPHDGVALAPVSDPDAADLERHAWAAQGVCDAVDQSVLPRLLQAAEAHADLHANRTSGLLHLRQGGTLKNTCRSGSQALGRDMQKDCNLQPACKSV